MFYEIDFALNAVAEEPGFDEKFMPYAPDRLPELVELFTNANCVCAVRLLGKN